jgi:purine-binding chemotaxis protein CheW
MDAFHVRLRVGREAYALPIENVTEVAELGELTRVPGSGRAVLGVRNLRGQVLPVFDLAQVLRVAHEGRLARIVVADQDGRTAGLAVDDVTDIAPLGDQLEETSLEYLASSVLEDGELVGVIDVARVFDALTESVG